jgi:Family of unknown function (DUF6491)
MKTSTVCLSLLLLAGCTSQGPQSQIGSEERAAREIQMTRTSDCVFHTTISDFHPLDDRHLVLYGSSRRHAYLAEIALGCYDVGSQVSLAAVDADGNGQVCGYGRDSVAYRGLGKVEHCRITALEKLTPDRLEQLGLAEPERPSKQDEDEDAEDQAEAEK